MTPSDQISCISSSNHEHFSFTTDGLPFSCCLLICRLQTATPQQRLLSSPTANHARFGPDCSLSRRAHSGILVSESMPLYSFPERHQRGTQMQRSSIFPKAGRFANQYILFVSIFGNLEVFIWAWTNSVFFFANFEFNRSVIS